MKGKELPGGLRLCGDWSATTGLANAARRLALALIHQGVDLSVSNFASGAPREAWLYPQEVRALEGGPQRPVGLWTLNVNELPQVSDEELSAATANGYNIGAWYWEFQTMPDWMQRQFERISEIWAPTKFVQRAMFRYSDKPVHVVPPVVPVFPVEAGGDVLRDRFGFPRGRTIFLATFDFNSTVSRKNPMGVIEAFGRAFPASSSTGPLLVVKAINLHRNQAIVTLLTDAIDAVGGVLIDQNMTGSEFANLFHVADVYVSLHRSEGFGLGLAESMAIGKPVIGTAYSGNLDFMSASNSCLVGYTLREVDEFDHAQNPGMEETYVKGALWADPDLDEAAQWMELLARDIELREQIGTRAALDMEASFSETAVAEVALNRLVALYRELGI